MVGNGGVDVLCYIAVDTSEKNIERHSMRLGEVKQPASRASAGLRQRHDVSLSCGNQPALSD